MLVSRQLRQRGDMMRNDELFDGWIGLTGEDSKEQQHARTLDIIQILTSRPIPARELTLLRALLAAGHQGVTLDRTAKAQLSKKINATTLFSKQAEPPLFGLICDWKETNNGWHYRPVPELLAAIALLPELSRALARPPDELEANDAAMVVSKPDMLPWKATI